MVRRIAFAVPGDLATPTGGYAYDRRMIAELERLGLDQLGGGDLRVGEDLLEHGVLLRRVGEGHLLLMSDPHHPEEQAGVVEPGDLPGGQSSAIGPVIDDVNRRGDEQTE